MQAKIILASPSKSRHDGSRPIYLRITHQRKRKYFTTSIFIKPDLWTDGQVKGDQTTNHMLATIEAKAWGVITELHKTDELTLRHFEKSWTTSTTDEPPHDLTTLFNAKVDDLLREGRHGGARPYKDALASLIRFGGKSLSIHDIDYRFLKTYVTDMRARGRRDTTISIYLRHLRVIVNEAKRTGIIKDYPFDRFKMNTLNIKTKPRAIATSAIQVIETMEPTLATDIFLFSYYNRGITFSDINGLTRSNIIDGRLTYTRSKTGGEFSVKISVKTTAIIIRYAKPDSDYLFPLNQTPKSSATDQYKVLKGQLKMVNKKLKAIGKSLGLEFPLTTYCARHTYATTLKRSGVNLAIISEALGHSSQAVTMVYLDSFNKEVIDETDSYL